MAATPHFRMSIIIPAYNEAESLPDLLGNIEATIKTHGYAAEIIVINDGSTDATAEVLTALTAAPHLHGDLHRYIPIFVQSAGFSMSEVKVKHHRRRFGRRKYGLKRIPKGFFDLITVLFLTHYKSRPLHFFAGIGSLFIFSGMVVLAVLTALYFLPLIELPRLPLGIAGGFCLLTGFLLTGLGLLGELLVAYLREMGKE